MSNQKNSLSYYRKKWFRLGTLSMLIIGFGISLIGEAIILKTNEAAWFEWTALGTFALIVFNAGICVFGESVACKVHYERKKEELD